MKTPYVLLLLLLFTCCQKINRFKPANSIDIANVEIKEYPFDNQNVFDSDNYFDSIKYVYLEETEASMIPSIEQILFTDSLLIVVSKKAKSIFFFDYNGKYLHKIDKRGRGHGEYLRQEKVMVDEKRRKVIVYDNDTNRILYYDFNGNFLKTIDNFSNSALVRDLINTSDGGFICYNYSYYGNNKKLPAGLWKVDSCGKFSGFIYELKEYYPSRTAYGLTNLTHLKGDTIGFLDSNTSITYHSINDTIYCRSRYRMPDKTKADYAGVKETDDKYMSVFSYTEKGNYIFMSWGTVDRRVFATALSKSDNTIETGLSFSPTLNRHAMMGGNSADNNKSNILTYWMDHETLELLKEQHPDSILRSGIEQVLNTAPKSTNIVIQITYVKN